MKGTANAPAKKPTAAELGVQAKLTGTEGQFVGFDKNKNAVPMDPLTGTENQYIGFDKETGKQVVKDLPDFSSGGGSTTSETAFFGTVGLDWAEDEATGVKSQLVAIEGVLKAHNLGCLDVIMTHERTTEGYAAFVEEQNQFLEFITNGDAETVDGGVMFYIYGEANTVEIPFGLVVS